MNHGQLMSAAIEARQNAYSPYSHFAVGAALLCVDGTVYTGINIENAAYSPTVCAERVAFFKAVSDGKRDFSAIAVSGGKAGNPPDKNTAPCGVCRQVMMEFCNPGTFEIILGGDVGSVKAHKLSDLLPLGFGPENLV